MVITTTVTDALKLQLLDYIDTNFTYVAFGTGTATINASDTVIASEVFRAARQEYTELGNTATLSGLVGAGNANGETLRTAAVFDSASGVTLQAGFNLQNPIIKTSDKELWADFDFEVDVIEEQ
jgi:hypothetical protein